MLGLELGRSERRWVGLCVVVVEPGAFWAGWAGRELVGKGSADTWSRLWDAVIWLSLVI